MASTRRRNPKKEPPECERLAELRKAVGPWPWRAKAIHDSTAVPISEEMELMLALVVFDGYEF